MGVRPHPFFEHRTTTMASPAQNRRDRARNRVQTMALAFLLSSPALPLHAAGPGYVGGLTPYERPVGAPVKAEVTGLGERGFQGIEGVPPASLVRMKGSQGEWYTPFSRPGMPGPYDLRGWHRPADGKGLPAPGGGRP